MMKTNPFYLILLLLSLGIGACDLEKIEPGSGNASKFKTTVGINGNDYPSDVLAASDGGFVVTGYSYVGNNQAYIAKVNNLGALQWEKSLGGTADDYANAVTETTDGGFVFCGRNNSDLYLVKLNAAGNVVWEKTYGSVDSVEIGFGIVPATGGDFWVGYQNTSGNPIQIRMMRINGNGGKVSEKLVKAGSFFMSKMIKTSEGQFVMVGSGFGSGTASYTLKLDANGSFIWDNTYPMPVTNYTPAYDVVELADKSLVVAGSDLGANDHDFNLIAYTGSGGTLWAPKTWGGANADELFGIDRTDDNELIVAGYTTSFSSQREIYLSKRKASDGAMIWEKHFESANEGIVAACPDGGFVVCAAQNITNGDILIVKTDKDGNFE